VKEPGKPNNVLRSAPVDSPVKTEAGVAKRSSVRDMAALFKRT